MDYKVKLGATLSFNLGLERDMVEQIERLKAKHKLGEFISNSLRIVFENPELLEKQGASLEKFGLTDNRKKLNDAINIEIGRIRDRVNKTYQMAYELYSLAKFNKQLNIYDSSKNILASQFILNKQIEDLKSLLGVTCIEQPANLHKVDSSVDDVLEYILLCHSDIVDELKSTLTGSSDYISKIDELNNLADKHINDSKHTAKATTYDGKPQDKEVTDRKDDIDLSSSEKVKETKEPIKETNEPVKEPDKSDEDKKLEGFEMSDDADTDDISDLLGLM